MASMGLISLASALLSSRVTEVKNHMTELNDRLKALESSVGNSTLR